MGRSSGLVVVAVFSAIVMGLFANSPSAQAGGNCQAKLVGKSYDCSINDNDYPSFTQCWDFFTGGDSQYFDLNNGQTDFGCACDASGPSKFNDSANTFECSDSAAPYSYNGKIEGKKLSVQGVGADGEQYIGTCTLRSSPCP